jgi:hypothetical protein
MEEKNFRGRGDDNTNQAVARLSRVFEGRRKGNKKITFFLTLRKVVYVS